MSGSLSSRDIFELYLLLFVGLLIAYTLAVDIYNNVCTNNIRIPLSLLTFAIIGMAFSVCGFIIFHLLGELKKEEDERFDKLRERSHKTYEKRIRIFRLFVLSLSVIMISIVIGALFVCNLPS